MNLSDSGVSYVRDTNVTVCTTDSTPREYRNEPVWSGINCVAYMLNYIGENLFLIQLSTEVLESGYHFCFLSLYIYKHD